MKTTIISILLLLATIGCYRTPLEPKTDSASFMGSWVATPPFIQHVGGAIYLVNTLDLVDSGGSIGAKLNGTMFTENTAYYPAVDSNVVTRVPAQLATLVIIWDTPNSPSGSSPTYTMRITIHSDSLSSYGSGGYGEFVRR